jgi:hypothetical protein
MILLIYHTKQSPTAPPVFNIKKNMSKTGFVSLMLKKIGELDRSWKSFRVVDCKTLLLGGTSSSSSSLCVGGWEHEGIPEHLYIKNIFVFFRRLCAEIFLDLNLKTL